MALSSSRLSTDIYNRWTADYPRNGFSHPLSTDQQSLLQSFCDAVAAALVAEITDHGVVSATGGDPQGGTVNSTGTIS